MAIILTANKVNMFVSSVLFVFWYHSPYVFRHNVQWLLEGRTDFREIRVFKIARLCKFSAVLCISAVLLEGMCASVCFCVLTECGRPVGSAATGNSRTV
jgi:hypothetical protein